MQIAQVTLFFESVLPKYHGGRPIIAYRSAALPEAATGMAHDHVGVHARLIKRNQIKLLEVRA